MDEETTKKQEDFYQQLELQLNAMDVTIITANDVEKVRPSIGQGAFGKVYKGIYKGKVVAIKKILIKEEYFTTKVLDDIVNEIKNN